MIISAQDARDIQSGKIRVSKSRLAEVCEFIIGEASNGKNSARWVYWFDDETEGQLIKLGYTVIYYPYDSYYEISW